MRGPLVTITIPTFKSEKTLEKCLLAIKNQTYKNIEVSIIDGGSSDKVLQLSKNYYANYVFFPGSLLAARYRGVKMAKGKYTLIFDSDQVLEKKSIERAVKVAEDKGLDMLVFEENVYKKDTFIEKLFDCDRKVINAIGNLSPFTGVIMPRFFRTGFLKNAYENIPQRYFQNTGGPDHAIVYYECWLLSKKISVLSKAVKHMEPKTIRQLGLKFYRWGYTSIDTHYGKYHNLMTQKARFRSGLFTKGLIIESLGSILLLIIKGIGFKLGYFIAMVDKKSGRKL